MLNKLLPDPMTKDLVTKRKWEKADFLFRFVMAAFDEIWSRSQPHTLKGEDGGTKAVEPDALFI